MTETTHTYQNRQVTLVRDAREGDPEFDAAAGPQVIIRDADGKNRTVAKSDVTSASK